MATGHILADDNRGNVLRRWPPVPSYDHIAFNLLATALYNARHAGEPLKTWDEIAANEITRNAYLALASVALRACFPTEGY